MALLTTGLIENTLVVGVRPTSTFEVLISNDDTVIVSVQITGFFLTGTTKTLYVSELFNIPVGTAVVRIYFAQFDAFEFQFNTSSDAVEISAWGKDATGKLVAAHRVLPAELNPIGSGAAGATGANGLAAFGYVFDNETPAQSIAVGSDVLYSNNGPLQLVSHIPGTSSIVVNLAGIYNIDFGIYTNANNPQVWGIAVNNVVQQVFNNAGQTLVASATLSLALNDSITIRNVNTLPNPAVLRAGFNTAWVKIEKVNN